MITNYKGVIPLKHRVIEGLASVWFGNSPPAPKPSFVAVSIRREKYCAEEYALPVTKTPIPAERAVTSFK